MMADLSTLSTELKQWDGKTVADIIQIYERYALQDTFLTQLLGLLGRESYQAGASWLLKHYLDSGSKVNDQQATTILHSLQKLVDWRAKLHVLQSLCYVPIVENNKAVVKQFLREQIVSDNKFVRAWAYNGFYLLAKQYQEYQAETEQLFEMAMRDESASVKARIRNVMKKGF